MWHARAMFTECKTGVNVVIILKWIIDTGYESVDSIRVAQDGIL
jgi:hypothetical protein